MHLCVAHSSTRGGSTANEPSFRIRSVDPTSERHDFHRLTELISIHLTCSFFQLCLFLFVKESSRLVQQDGADLRSAVDQHPRESYIFLCRASKSPTLSSPLLMVLADYPPSSLPSSSTFVCCALHTALARSLSLRPHLTLWCTQGRPQLNGSTSSRMSPSSHTSITARRPSRTACSHRTISSRSGWRAS